MPADQFDGFAAQFPAMRAIAPEPKDLPQKDIHAGNLYSLGKYAIPVIDRVSSKRLANTSSLDRHILGAVRGVMSVFLKIPSTGNPPSIPEHPHLRRLCQHTAAEQIQGAEWAWFQVQTTAAENPAVSEERSVDKFYGKGVTVNGSSVSGDDGTYVRRFSDDGAVYYDNDSNTMKLQYNPGKRNWELKDNAGVTVVRTSKKNKSYTGDYAATPDIPSEWFRLVYNGRGNVTSATLETTLQIEKY